MKITEDIRSRFRSFVFVDVLEKSAADRCWNWTGHVTGRGYGSISVYGRPKLAHRVSWNIYKGLIPIGKLVLHKCNNGKCVNPDHLYIGSHVDNIVDATNDGLMRKRKFHEGEIWLMKRLYEKSYPYGKIGRISIRMIAKVFKTSGNTVNRICEVEGA